VVLVAPLLVVATLAASTRADWRGVGIMGWGNAVGRGDGPRKGRDVRRKLEQGAGNSEH